MIQHWAGARRAISTALLLPLHQLLPQLTSNQGVIMHSVFYALKTTDETHSLIEIYRYMS